MRARIAAVRAYLGHRPGVVGVVLRDRSTGAVWENSRAHAQIYMASTSKLAMAVTLLMQDQAGVIHLSNQDWSVMHDMLHVSSDTRGGHAVVQVRRPVLHQLLPADRPGLGAVRAGPGDHPAVLGRDALLGR
jgi:hypothetical protein